MLNYRQHPSVDSATLSHSHIDTKSWTPKTLVTPVEILSKNTCTNVAPNLCMSVFIFMDRPQNAKFNVKSKRLDETEISMALNMEEDDQLRKYAD
jgi:hypothetical protein